MKNGANVKIATQKMFKLLMNPLPDWKPSKTEISHNAPKAKTVRTCTISNGDKVRNLPNSPVRLTKGRATKTLITPWRCDVLALVKSDINQC